MTDQPTPWRKSTRSANGTCVETRRTAGRVQVRDSKDPGGPVLTFTPAEFADLLAGLKEGV